MSEASPPVQVSGASRTEQAFPKLTPAQIERFAARGRVHRVERGELLFKEGDEVVPFFVVISGGLEIVRGEPGEEQLVVRYEAGQFTGEINLLSGRRVLTRCRVTESGEVLELDREALLRFVQTDSELSEILMRAFILRRVELIARGISDVILIGSSHSSGTLRLKEFLTRNGYPYTYLDLDRDADTQELLDRFHVEIADVPVVICRCEIVLKNPTNQQVADCLGFNTAIDAVHVRDVVVVGAGPAGLAAAVYAASEGLDVLVLESNSPGGQAAASSKIENYLGFPTGISGQELAGRAYMQAEKFGAQLMIARGAARLLCDRKPYVIEMENGQRVPARSVIIATGAEYRKLAVENLGQFEGTGIYYGATFVESQLCRGEEVIVVGGGNSAGQAAVFLAQSAGRVHMLVRSDGLAETMSRYLIRRIEENPAITLRTGAEIVGLDGSDRLERVHVRDVREGTVTPLPIQHVFVMTGAVPSTTWLEDCLVLDENGFIKTGPDLTPDELLHWGLPRPPHLLETSLPGVFAVGDVRSGNVKRVASAVGEGSIAVSFVHQVLHD
jgi:thioredoxin reductase (NADPH)